MLLLCLLPLLARAQGTVVFYNHVLLGGVDAPVFDVDGTTRLAGPAFLAQLYAGPTAAALLPVTGPAPFQTGAAAGYWQPPQFSTQIPTVPGGGVAFLQVRAWASARGATYDQASAAGGPLGLSNVFSVTTGGDTMGGAQPPSLPAYLVGLQSFGLKVVPMPEPGTLALGLLGAAMFFWRSRRTAPVL